MIPNFFGLLWRYRSDIFVQRDFVGLSAIAAALAWWVPTHTLERSFEAFSVAVVGVSAGLLGLVLALLAVVMSFLPDGLFMFLRGRPGGLAGHAFPFSFAAVLAVLATVAGAGSLLVVPQADELWVRLTVGATWFLFTWTLSSFLELLKLVFDYWELKGIFLDEEGPAA